MTSAMFMTFSITCTIKENLLDDIHLLCPAKLGHPGKKLCRCAQVATSLSVLGVLENTVVS